MVHDGFFPAERLPLRNSNSLKLGNALTLVKETPGAILLLSSCFDELITTSKFPETFAILASPLSCLSEGSAETIIFLVAQAAGTTGRLGLLLSLYSQPFRWHDDVNGSFLPLAISAEDFSFLRN